MEQRAFLYIEEQSDTRRGRIRYYLDGETRPAFAEEASADEAEIFKAFEYALEPESVDELSPRAVVERLLGSDPRNRLIIIRILHQYRVFSTLKDTILTLK